MTADSKLVSYVKASPNHSGKRTHTIDTITIHCVAANATIESLGATFANPSRQASSQYGIGTDGRIGQYVPETYRSWCTGNRANDQRAITIEVSNNGGAPDWPVSAKAYESLLRLLVDICQRNGIKKLVWSTNKSDRLNHRNGCNMTVHRDYAPKSCPGNYLYNRHGQIAAEVNRRLDQASVVTNVDYNVKVTAHDGLNCRTSPMYGSIVTTYPYNTILHISKEQNNWGYTGKGWVSLAYTEKEDDDMTQEQFNEMFKTAMTAYRKTLQDNDAQNWSEEDRRWAIDNGLFEGSGTLPNGEPNYMWDDFANRVQLAALFHRYYEKFNK